MQLYKDNLGKVSITVEQGYWNIDKDYDKLTVVEKEGTFGTYISRKPVPAGTVLTDRTYWIPFSSLKEEIVIEYNEFIDRYNSVLKNHEERLVDVEQLKSRVEEVLTNTDNLINDTNELLTQVRLDIATANETLNRAQTLIDTYEENKEEIYQIAQDSKNTVDELVNTKGEPNGLATLDESGHIVSNQLPSYVDDVLEFASLSNFPTKGESGKIYIANDTNLTYRWSGSRYVEIPKGLALGLTSTTAYPGDKGQQNRGDIDTLKETVGNLPTYIVNSVGITTQGASIGLKIGLHTKDTTNNTWPYSTYTVTPPNVTSNVNGLMLPADKKKIDNLPVNIMVRPQLDESVSVTAEDSSENVWVFNSSVATYNSSTNSYTVADEQPILLPKFSISPAAPGLIDSKYAEYIRKMIYEHRAKGNVATAELNVTPTKISLDTSVIQATFNSDYSHLTDSLIVSHSQQIPIANSSRLGLMSASHVNNLTNVKKVTDKVNNKGFVYDLTVDSDNNLPYYQYHHFGEGADFRIAVDIKDATPTLHGYMSAEDKASLDNIKTFVTETPSTIITDVAFDVDQDPNALTFVQASKMSNGIYNVDTETVVWHPKDATPTMHGYMSAEDKTKFDKNLEDVEAINTTLETKANIDDLSNVLAEEVIDEPLLEEINTLTRETIKKDLFIDMWNKACGSYGRYNAETGYFELNGLTDITYEEALDIYENGRTAYPSVQTLREYCRTNILVRTSYVYNTFYWTVSLKNLASGSAAEVLRIASNNQEVSASNIEGMLFNCKKLKKIIGIMDIGSVSTTRLADWELAPLLEEFKIKRLATWFTVKNMKSLNLASFQYMITNAINTKPITITVHPDVYAKLTGDNTNAAASALTPEEAAQWQQLVTDAAAKQISFATV